MILQSDGLHITLIADDMPPLDTTIDAIFAEIYTAYQTAYQDQMPILAATIKQELRKNPVTNAVPASIPDIAADSILIADNSNPL